MATSRSTSWFETTKGKIVGATAVVAASASLISVGVDLIKTVLKIPANVYDKTNEDMFKKHFNKTPIVSQPVQIKATSATVEMLLQVYDSGDVFVRYGEFQQWLPFKKLKIAQLSLLPEAMAQSNQGPQKGSGSKFEYSSPNSVKWQRVEQLNVPLSIDIDKIKNDVSPSNRSPAADSWSKAFLVSEVQQERSAFGPTTKNYERIFAADPGYKFTKADIDLGSANNASIQSLQILDGGRSLRIQYSLTSGPVFDQYRGWIHATIKTEQEKSK